MLPTQQEAIARIERMLMAPCCYTQTIDVHMSDVARDMRREVATMVLQGQTEQQIFDHYKAIYGRVILAVPDGAIGRTAFAIPAAASALATSGLVYLLYRFRRRAASVRAVAISAASGSAALSAEESKQLLERIRQETAW